MCGIAGITGVRNVVGASDAVQAMMHALRRRGPDSEGMHQWNSTVFGHRRLAVFDPSSAGQQPMLSEDQRVGIVFNGAIYNFRHLRADLEARGHRFRSGTDTEVLLEGYRAWGIDALARRAHGMFAFAIWDQRLETLFLVRDRLGVKPLVYDVRGQVLAFASTPRALCHATPDPEIDERAVAHFLLRGYVPEDLCIFRGHTKVLPGTIVEWHNGRVSTRTYWSAPTPTEERCSFEEAVERTEQLFVESVQRRLEADVPLAALLSGGIDSALVCWAMVRAGADVAAYTVAVPGYAEDESDDARRTAAALDVRHHVLSIESDAAALVADLAAAFGEPFAAASALGMLAVSQAITREATVVLTGDGGDDLFLGYPRHRYLRASELVARWTPPSVASTWIRHAHAWRPQRGALRRAVHFIDYTTAGLGAVVRAGEDGAAGGRGSLWGPRLRECRLPDDELEWSPAGGRRVLREHLQHVMTRQFSGEYLTKVDGATMYHGLEARSPFLDQSLWEFGAALSPALRLRRWRLKAILRTIAARRLGSRVATARKRGFEIPVGRWLASDPAGLARETLAHEGVADAGFLDARRITSRFEHEARAGQISQPLWYAFVLHSWIRSVQAEHQQALHTLRV